ncbi:MAG: cytochrome b5 domain-containing protein [Wenzhouxiangella sp.]
MKKFIFAVFIAFWASVATIATMQALTPPPSDRSNGADPASFTMAEVAEHDTLDDCWMVIEGEVYDFTDYIPEHPSPARVMAPWCGEEATEGMRTKGIGRDHSPAAWAMMEDYRIGELEGN